MRKRRLGCFAWKERRLSWEVIMGWRILLCIFSTSAFAYALYVIPA
jgi:hypothetical protein